jgi:hemerythrin-like domain-containing protein
MLVINRRSIMVHDSMRIILDEHSALSAMLRSVSMMLDRGPQDDRDRFFDVLRAMLFYVDEFPERQHHPKESTLLFPRVAELAPQTQETIRQLDHDHAKGEASVRELQHLLLAWELLGESRRTAFEQAARAYCRFYLEHMRLEETIILPAAQKVLTERDWQFLDVAFAANVDPLARQNLHDPDFDLLFSRIVMQAPTPIGLGES